MTTNTARRSGMKRGVSEVVCYNCKEKGHYANKCPANKLFPVQRNGAPLVRRGHIQTMSAWLSRQLVSQLHLFLSYQRISPALQSLVQFYLRCKLIVFGHEEGRATAAGQKRLLSPYDRPHDDPERRAAPSPTPGASTTANRLSSWIARVTSHRNGDARAGVDNDADSKQREVNVSVCLYLAFVVVVRSASKHGGGDNIFAS